jgi:hypothetical protein
MGNTLIAAGPDFKSGFVDKLPSGNSDVAPTVAHLLGIPAGADAAMDGRVLREALAGASSSTEDAKPPQTTTLTARRSITIEKGENDKTTRNQKDWSQYLKVTTYAGRRYYDEGNAGAPPAPPADR